MMSAQVMNDLLWVEGFTGDRSGLCRVKSVLLPGLIVLCSQTFNITAFTGQKPHTLTGKDLM